MAVEDSSQLSSPDVLQRMFSKKRKKRKNIVIISDSEGEEDDEKNVREVKRQKSPPNNNVEKNEDSFTEDEDDVVDLTNVKNKNDSTYDVLSSEIEDVTTVQKRSQKGKKKDDSYDLSFVVDDDEIEYDYKPRNVKKKKKKREEEDEFVPSESEDTTSPKPFKQQRRKIRKKKIIESDDDDDDDDYEEGVDSENLKPKDNTMWQCKRCTLLNNIALEYCTLCAGERPAKYSSIAREQQEMMTRKRFLERFKQKKKKTPQKQNKKRRRRRLMKRGNIVDEEEEEEEEEECTNFSTSQEDSSSEQEEDEEDMIEPLLQKCRDIESKLRSSHPDISLLSSTNLQGSLPHHLKSYQMIGLKWLYVCVGEFHSLYYYTNARKHTGTVFIFTTFRVFLQIKWDLERLYVTSIYILPWCIFVREYQSYCCSRENVDHIPQIL